MTLFDYYFRKLPEYYDTMYLDGYTPEEIYMAFKKSMYKNLLEPEAVEVIIKSEVKVK